MKSKKKLGLTSDELINIHNHLHWGSDSVTIAGITYPFQISSGGWRYVEIMGIKFQKQNVSKPSKWGRMAKMGHLITWGIRPGNWIRIVDGKVEDS